MLAVLALGDRLRWLVGGRRVVLAAAGRQVVLVLQLAVAVGADVLQLAVVLVLVRRGVVRQRRLVLAAAAAGRRVAVGVRGAVLIGQVRGEHCPDTCAVSEEKSRPPP